MSPRNPNKRYVVLACLLTVIILGTALFCRIDVAKKKAAAADFWIRNDFWDAVQALRNDRDVADWYVEPSNLNYDIEKTGSGLRATVYVKYFRGSYTAKYYYETIGKRWVFIRCENQPPFLVDQKIREIMSENSNRNEQRH